MNTTYPRFFTFAIAAIALSISARLAAAQTVKSRWKDQTITIDGVAAEWPVLTALDDNIATAAANDAQNLYLAIATATRSAGISSPSPA